MALARPLCNAANVVLHCNKKLGFVIRTPRRIRALRQPGLGADHPPARHRAARKSASPGAAYGRNKGERVSPTGRPGLASPRTDFATCGLSGEVNPGDRFRLRTVRDGGRGRFIRVAAPAGYSALPPWRLHSDLKCFRSLPCSPLALA